MPIRIHDARRLADLAGDDRPICGMFAEALCRIGSFGFYEFQ